MKTPCLIPYLRHSTTLGLPALAFALLFVAMPSANAQIFTDSINPSNDAVTLYEYGFNGSQIGSTLLSGTPNVIGGISTSGSDIFITNPAYYPQGSVSEFGLDGTTINSSLVTSLSNPLGVAVSGSTLYIAHGGDGGGSNITTAPTTGSTVAPANPTPFISTFDPPTGGLAIANSNLYITEYINGSGQVGEYTTAGAKINASLISTGLLDPLQVIIAGTHLYVTSVNLSTSAESLGEYNLDGTQVSASLFPTLKSFSVTASDSDLFVDYKVAGQTTNTIGEYDLDGNAINPSLITGVTGNLLTVEAAPEPSSWALSLLAASSFVLLRQSRRKN